MNIQYEIFLFFKVDCHFETEGVTKNSNKLTSSKQKYQKLKEINAKYNDIMLKFSFRLPFKYR